MKIADCAEIDLLNVVGMKGKDWGTSILVLSWRTGVETWSKDLLIIVIVKATVQEKGKHRGICRESFIIRANMTEMEQLREYNIVLTAVRVGRGVVVSAVGISRLRS